MHVKTKVRPLFPGFRSHCAPRARSIRRHRYLTLSGRLLSEKPLRLARRLHYSYKSFLVNVFLCSAADVPFLPPFAPAVPRAFTPLPSRRFPLLLLLLLLRRRAAATASRRRSAKNPLTDIAHKLSIDPYATVHSLRRRLRRRRRRSIYRVFPFDFITDHLHALSICTRTLRAHRFPRQ